MLSVYAFDAAFSPAECDVIVGLAGDSALADAGLVRGGANHNLRRADLAWLDDREGTDWIMVRIMDLVAEANRTHFDFALTEFGESPQIARYGAERQGHFTWHSDIGDGVFAARRKLTMVIQLSDPADYEGGALELQPDAGVHAANRTRGSGVLFPSFTLHRVTPVTQGERFSLSTWVHGPAFR
ncbi:2OG-Fe(II) oxygenase [Celeribacter marinus]|uniref:Oxidoreductase domain protein n=1 Tax=Celeribacter marinus TaxID=1397108 RepID=A0A0N9ZDW9_9RHOB|nr:2OG-Fe(II) oxygenase [Celeribacter marinus]ALI55002.1 oxidoreductase domain protein [Celeribacter marinus]SFK04462.1 PKHD-type hydroxylase [Celeribacter marinus]